MPLIASDCGGPAELFETGKLGLLVPNRDVPAMAVAMGELSSNVALRQRFSVASRIFVLHKFSPVRTYCLLANCYKYALAVR